MRETCYCGRSGEVQERKPITDTHGIEALECPKCGHLDYLSWLPEHTRAHVIADARRRARERRAPAA